MKTCLVSSLAAPAVALCLLLPACGSPSEGTGGQTETGGASTGSTTAGTSGASTGTPTSGDSGSITDGMTTAPTSNGPTTDPSTTQDPSVSGTGETGQTDTAETSGPGTDSTSTSTSASTGAIDETTGSSGDSSTGEPCIPIAEVCNDLDDDCNGIIDDLDIGGDGICDCLDIALFGNKGANPAAQFEMWLEAQGTQVDRIQLDNTPLTPQLVDKYDIIILDRLVRSYTPGEATVMQDWVLAGGGLMSMTGYTGAPPDVTYPNSLISPMGLTYNNSKGIISGPVTQWVPHPVSKDITSVTFLGGFYIDLVDDGIGQNTIVATLPAGPVAVAQVRKDGKLFIWGDEWIEFDSEWQNIPQIKQLWANILSYLSPANFCSIPQ